MKENEYDNGYIERQTVSSNPPELPQIRVSVFENYFAQKPLGDVDLIKWCKTAKFKEQVIAFRTTSNEKVRQRIKRNLPCITPSGIFKTRSRDGLVQHTGFICIDIDHKDNGVFGPTPARAAPCARAWRRSSALQVCRSAGMACT